MGTEVIDYGRVTANLAASELSASAAEAQGIFCGLVCAGDLRARDHWLSELLPDVPPEDLLAQEARGPLLALADETLEQLESDGLELELLMPDEDRPLAERATAVYDWSRGFLFGLALAGLQEADLSGEVRGVFSDFTALTQMDLDDLDESDDNEESLMEVVEFIRIAAMLVYAERGSANQGAR